MFELLGNSINESAVALTPEEDAFMESFTNAECNYDDAEEAFLYLAMENDQNFNAILNAVAVQEMSYYVEHGEEMVYEAVDFKGFFATIKKAVLRAWEKIKAVFKKVFDTIQSWILSDKKFLSKYEKDIMDAEGTPIEFKGYQVNLTYFPIAELKSVVKKYDNYRTLLFNGVDRDEIVKTIIGNAVSGATDKEGYVKGVKKKLGIADKVDIKSFDAASAVANIKNARDSKAMAKKSYDEAKKLFAYMASQCDRMATAHSKGVEKEDSKKLSVAAGNFSKVMNTCTSLAHTAMQLQIKAINIANRQAKAMAQKAISIKKKEGSTTKGFATKVEELEESALLGGLEVDLI